MFMRKLALLCALAAIGVLGAGAASSSAAVYIHGGTSTGNVLASGTAINGSLASGTRAVLTTSLGTITCSVSPFAGTVGASGGSSLTGSLSNLSFSTCTDTIPFIDVSSCDFYTDTQNPASFSIADSSVVESGNSATGTLSTTVTVRCHLSLGAGDCFFRASGVSGVIASAWDSSGAATSNSLTYSSVPVTLQTRLDGGLRNSGFCPSGGTFSARYSPITTGSPARLVIVNRRP
jgi:hypothetical protein